MENICVNFETWTIADGSYSPMAKGDIEVFAIGIYFDKIRLSLINSKYLKQLKNSSYAFSGQVIYTTYLDDEVIVIDTGILKFFISDVYIKDFKVGQYVEGFGSLSVDSYTWMHIEGEDGAPHIYYDFVIEKILGNAISEEEQKQLDEYWENDDIVIMPIRPPKDDRIVEFQNMDDCGMFLYLELKMLKEADPFELVYEE